MSTEGSWLRAFTVNNERAVRPWKPSSKRFRVSASSCAEYLNICLNHILLRIIACYILLSIAIDVIGLESNQNFILFIIFMWMVRSLVRTTPIKQGSLPTSRVGLTLFGRVYSSYLKRKDQKIPKFWDHGSQKICTNRDHFILHWDFSRKILPFLYLYRFILLDIMVDVPYSNLTPSGPLSKIWQKKWSGCDRAGYDSVLVKIIEAASNFRPIKDDHI